MLDARTNNDRFCGSGVSSSGGCGVVAGDPARASAGHMHIRADIGSVVPPGSGGLRVEPSGYPAPEDDSVTRDLCTTYPEFVSVTSASTRARVNNGIYFEDGRCVRGENELVESWRPQKVEDIGASMCEKESMEHPDGLRNGMPRIPPLSAAEATDPAPKHATPRSAAHQENPFLSEASDHIQDVRLTSNVTTLQQREESGVSQRISPAGEPASKRKSSARSTSSPRPSSIEPSASKMSHSGKPGTKNVGSVSSSPHGEREATSGSAVCQESSSGQNSTHSDSDGTGGRRCVEVEEVDPHLLLLVLVVLVLAVLSLGRQIAECFRELAETLDAARRAKYEENARKACESDLIAETGRGKRGQRLPEIRSKQHQDLKQDTVVADVTGGGSAGWLRGSVAVASMVAVAGVVGASQERGIQLPKYL